MKKILMLMLLAAPLVAQQQCPVGVNYLTPVGNDKLEINWTNNSDKVVTAFKFAVQYVDSFGHPLVNPGYDGFEHEHINIKPGRKDGSVFSTFTAHQHGWAAAQSVRFKDGSVWEDDGTLSCRGIDWLRLHGK